MSSSFFPIALRDTRIASLGDGLQYLGNKFKMHVVKPGVGLLILGLKGHLFKKNIYYWHYYDLYNCRQNVDFVLLKNQLD